MTVSRLLKSCAIPPVSWPTASIFCDWRSWSPTSSCSRVLSSLSCSKFSLTSLSADSTHFRSVISRMIFAAPSSRPARSRTGDMLTETAISLPSFRRRTFS